MFLLLQMRLSEIILGRRRKRKKGDVPDIDITDPRVHARVLREQEELRSRIEALSGKFAQHVEAVDGRMKRMETALGIVAAEPEQRGGYAEPDDE